MAGDWIKMRSALCEDPDVIRIAAATGLDEFAVVGRLLKFWGWADAHTIDGNATSVTGALAFAWLDRYLSVTGIAKALVEVGWVSIDNAGIHLINFDRHNGETGKQRALTAKRAAKFRVRSNAASNAIAVMKPLSCALPTEEKIREEKSREENSTEESEKIEAQAQIGDSGETCEAQVPPAPPQRAVVAANLSTGMTADQAAAIAAEAAATAKRLKAEEKNRERQAKRAAEKAAREAARIAEDRDYAGRIAQVVEHYRTHHPRSLLNGLTPESEEWAPIVARLKSGFTVEDLCAAIDGCHVTPHNCGQNKNGQKYQGLELIMRTGDQVTRFIENLAQHGDGSSVLTETTRHNLAAGKSWLLKHGIDPNETGKQASLLDALGSDGEHVQNEGG